MRNNKSMSFVVPVNDDNIYKNNFMASPLFKCHNDYQFIKQIGFSSASKAYNDGIDKSTNEIIVFAHQDIVFPDFWHKELIRALEFLEETDPKWGVIGCYGNDLHGKGFGYMYCVGNEKLLGRLSVHPSPVQTLDEVVLIIKRSSELRFDDKMPKFHLYGADICMTAASRGKKCYAISAFCLHNTNKLPFLPNEYFECYKYIKKKWYKSLPIDTTCMRIEQHWTKQYLIYKYVRRVKYILINNILNNNNWCMRSEDPISLLNKLKTNYVLYFE